MTGVLVMPDQSEIIVGQGSRTFGRTDFIRYITPAEKAPEVSRAHFTITQQSGEFYLSDGGPDPNNPSAWKQSVNRTMVNGNVVQPGAKQKLNNNDPIDVAGGLVKLTFRLR
jgi:pSer/pThr/pTyr-binding forkhead associated (FHA) protein